jgi:hypothetical protein
MADIKKNAKTGNMVRGPDAVYLGKRMVPSSWTPFLTETTRTALISERMQDPSKGSSPYTSIHPEIHPDASPTASRLA